MSVVLVDALASRYILDTLNHLQRKISKREVEEIVVVKLRKVREKWDSFLEEEREVVTDGVGEVLGGGKGEVVADCAGEVH